MIIGFHKEFVPLIESGVKIHTIRRDEKNRWKAGNTMQMYTDIRTKEMKRFAEKVCVSVQYLTINTERKEIFIHRKLLMSNSEIEHLAKNDGFESVDRFWDWFSTKKYESKFVGKIIHWTNKTY